jgi:hypothetical protein
MGDAGMRQKCSTGFLSPIACALMTFRYGAGHVLVSTHLPLMLKLLLSRFVLALAVALGVATLVFLLMHLTSGDPVEAMLGESASGADRAALRTALGLDAPLPAQWWRFVSGLATGDLGRSIGAQQTVAMLIAERLPNTVVLALAALAIAITLALPLGLLSALRLGGVWDRATSVFAVLGMSLPSFVLGPMLMMVFAVWLGWLPVSGSERAIGLVLPAVTLGLALAAPLSRMASLMRALAASSCAPYEPRGSTTSCCSTAHRGTKPCSCGTMRWYWPAPPRTSCSCGCRTSSRPRPRNPRW